MTYIIRKKNSPYYVKDMTQKVDGNFEILRWETSFTDVKDFIVLKIKGKKEALEKIALLKSIFPKEQMDFELEKANEK
jgi:hypothetical protein